MLAKLAMESASPGNDGGKDHEITSSGQVRVKRASVKYGTEGGVDNDELKIENDRMKTTIMILT